MASDTGFATLSSKSFAAYGHMQTVCELGHDMRLRTDALPSRDLSRSLVYAYLTSDRGDCTHIAAALRYARARRT